MLKIRSPKSEIRKKPETRNPNGHPGAENISSVFGFRISFGIRYSVFGIHFGLHSSFFLLNRITPIMATSSSTETISNGSV
jgi:hypothetical protein